MIIAFDLDGTLTTSKQNLTRAMTRLLTKLLWREPVLVVGGGGLAQFKKQLLWGLKPDRRAARDLYLLPTSGASFYHYHGGHLVKVYEERLAAVARHRIKIAIKAALQKLDYHPAKVWGELVEDRGTQITFSGLGSRAPLQAKVIWNKQHDIRRHLKIKLDKLLPDFSIRLGGLTSIDITKKGIDKVYGLRRALKYLKLNKAKLLYVGDALYPGGNDYVVKAAGFRTLKVTGPGQTAKLIKTKFL